MSDALGFSDGLSDRWRGAVDAHKAHAVRDWPREAVGLVDPEGEYHPCENVAANPVTHFEIPQRDWDALVHGGGAKPAAVLHSHTSQPDPETNATAPVRECPSAADMQGQMDMAIPWGITPCIESGAGEPFWFGDQVPKAPLYGRTFRHGVYDCYSFIRDWHKLVAGVTIPDFPRDLDWWEPVGGNVQQDLYMDGFERAGFKRVYRSAGPLLGDVFLCSIHAAVTNHGGVYVEDGLIGHHLLFQLSMRSPASIWRPKLDFLVRHESLPDDWMPESN